MSKASVIVGTLVLFGSIAYAGNSDQTFTVQGVLRDGQGVLQSSGVGLVVNLYTSQNATTAFYTQSYTTVPVENGFFSVEVSSTSLAFSTPDTWVGIQVSGDSAELPRQHIGATPYAFSAASLDSSLCVGCVQDGMIASGLNGAKVSNIVTAGSVPVGTVVAPNATTRTIAHLTLPSYPAAGFVVVDWSVVYNVNGTGGCNVALDAFTTPTDPSGNSSPWGVYLYGTSVAANAVMPLSGHAVLPVNAGANTVYLQGFSDCANFYWRGPSMIARYETANINTNALTVN
jgi:hypothetical protein